MSIKNRVAIVTGAARGMGKAVSKKLARHGAFVYVTDVDVDGVNGVAKEIVDELGDRAKAVRLDVTDYGDVEGLVEEAIKEHGRIDILVNNAGILRRRATLEDIPDEEWDLVMGVNVKGVFNCTKAVLPKMKERRYGKIVNLSSTAGRSTSELGGAHYTASKAAVLGLTRHTAREAAPYGINVNAICPSLVDTPMVRETTDPEELERFIGDIPMDRMATPEEAADLILFLVSDASSFVNGATIDFTGASLLI
ncbi:hypothetical protein AC482_05955 [miscellaneous Crenarchaeota group-15 archaeon DG-45]|uniref:Ketoreductase domain-containing protein n=1 Tax=miscellaneous Crenarchaeota group-15 archaeon DG-45 TaxID=1685127 RepID=A0A0M0BM83_9ARCH|nr:MAG: hypothetical protein AC482_05955 [miscellaneous Crenarchaeota group-15 archaeon DG-45]